MKKMQIMKYKINFNLLNKIFFLKMKKIKVDENARQFEYSRLDYIRKVF